jgi:hypothetical protein
MVEIERKAVEGLSVLPTKRYLRISMQLWRESGVINDSENLPYPLFAKEGDKNTHRKARSPRFFKL